MKMKMKMKVKMRNQVVFLLIALSLTNANPRFNGGVAATSRWRQDRFVVSMWVDPIVRSSEFNERYAEIARAN